MVTKEIETEDQNAQKREDIAEIVYDWIHENQITHRRTYAQIPDDQKASYRQVADKIINRLKQT